jgi:hypothetical protein
MTAVVVRHRLLTPDSEPVANRPITGRLRATAAWLADHAAEIIDTTSATSGEDGWCSLDLTPQSEIEEDGTYYEITISGTDTVHYCVVPDSGPVQLVDIMVDPDTLTPSAPVLASLYLPRAEKGAALGVASLGADGKVPTAQLPAGSGGGAVDSVNGQTGVVELDAADVGAQPAGDYATNSALTSAVAAAVAALVAGAPALLNTLDELAAALADDAAFSTTVTNALAGKIAASLIDAKGDLLVGSAADTPARLGVGTNGQTLVADSAQSTGLRWTTRDRNAYPLSRLGLIGACDDPSRFRDNSSFSVPAWFVEIPVQAGSPITTCWASVANAGTLGAGGRNGFALYDESGAQLGSTPTDNTLWASTGLRSKNLSVQVPAVSVDRYVYMEIRQTGWSAEPSFAFVTSDADCALFDGGWPSGDRRSFTGTGSDHPASIVPSSHGGSGQGYMPFGAVS